MVDQTATLDTLLKTRHPQIPLYALLMRPTALHQSPATPEGAEMLRQHLLFLWALEERGVLFASGPLDFGKPNQEGLCIIAAPSQAAAEDIASQDPYCRAGWRAIEVRHWQLNEGEAVTLGAAMIARRPQR